jgi:hypothetical protein
MFLSAKKLSPFRKVFSMLQKAEIRVGLVTAPWSLQIKVNEDAGYDVSGRLVCKLIWTVSNSAILKFSG